MKTKKISFQGLKGAYSDLACNKFYKEYEPHPCTTFAEALDAVRRNIAFLAMIPVENNIAGRVADMHVLLQSLKLKIIAEHYLKIEHNLLIRKNNQLQNIRFAYSHAHALSQCKNKLEELGLKPVTHLDTAGAAKFISENNDKKNAAVASSLAAKIYDLQIIKKNIEDDKNNITRFLVFSKKSLAVNLKKKIITTIVFDTKNKPASLYKVLGGFAENNINLTRLESFFVNKEFKQFSFLIDVESHPKSKEFLKATNVIKKIAYKIKILGFYEASTFRK